VGRQVRLIDIPPTVVAAAGLRPPPSFDGVDLARVIVDGSAPLPAVSQQDTPAEIRRLSLRTEDRKIYPRELLTTPLFGPRRGLWRRVVDAVHERRTPFALFDLADDPGEITDVVGERGRGREVASLRRQLEQELERRPAVTAPGSLAVGDLTDEQLRALGYIE
jgi:arylsulfatase A-like enzyme